MSIFTRTFTAGISRLFTLPRLSVPLILTLGLTLGAVLSVIAISSTLLYKPLQGIQDENTILSYEYRLKVSETLSVSYWNMRRLAAFNEAYKDLGTWAGIASGEQEVVVDNVTYATTQHTASNTILDVLGTRLIKGQGTNIDNPQSYVWISSSFWQQAFSGLDNALGKDIIINGKRYVIAGVIDDLLAVESDAPVLSQQIWLITSLPDLIGKAEVGDISNELDALLLKANSKNTLMPDKEEVQQWVEDFIVANVDDQQTEGYLNFLKNTPIEVFTSTYRDKFVGDSKNILVALFIAVIGLLLMATLNLLNLFIAHYQGRTKEFAIQITLGASLLRVRLLVLLENLPSFIIAAIFGLLTTGWVIKSLPLIAGNNIPMLNVIGIDAITVFSSLVIILLLSILFSGLALVDVNKHFLAENLNSSGKGLQAQSNQWLSRALMVVQLSVASILLTSSVMLAMQSYDAVYRDLGYEIGNSYSVSVYNTDEEWADTLSTFDHYQDSELRQVHESLDRIIESEVADSKVVINSDGALSDNFRASVYSPENAPDQRVVYQMRYLSANYFAIFNIPILAGANLSAQQISNKENRIVIDENMASALFPGVDHASIVGRAIKLRQNNPDGTVNPPVIITGIVAVTHSQAGAVDVNQMPAIYTASINAGRTINITVMMPDGKQLSPSMLEAELAKQFPRLQNLEVQSLNELKQQQTLSQQVSLWLVLTMTALTLLLSAIGVSGLTQMTTNHRRYELAVRMATGAKQASLVNFILKDALWMLAIGLGLGFTVSVLGYQKIQLNLDILPDFNWLAISVLDLGLIAIVLLSVFIPAWRIISSDPMGALRQE